MTDTQDTLESPEIETLAVVIEDDRIDGLQDLVEFRLTNPETGGDVCAILLRGDLSVSPFTRLKPFLEEEYNTNWAVLPTAPLAFGYLLSVFEVYGVDEDDAFNNLCECDRVFTEDEAGFEDAFSQFLEWRDSRTESERRLDLLDQAEETVEVGAPFYSEALENGSWRNTQGSVDAEDFAETVFQNHEFNPKQCYRNARVVVQEHWDNPAVEYVEGIALSEHGVRIVGHGWIEYDGVVVELTWPWHDAVGNDAVYFGVPLSRDFLDPRFERREGGPFVLRA